MEEFVLCKKCGSYNPEGSEVCSVCKEPLLVKSIGSIRQRIDVERLLVQLKSTINERYFITRFIGEGTFAQVYYAIDKATNSGVALKIFKPFLFKTEDEMSRLVWGIRGIKDISHPNLVRIFDADISHDGWVYVSMKFIYGMSLKNTIKLRIEVGKPFSFEEIEPLFFQIGEILNEMHPTICHGDFKPSNIIIQPDYIKLTDATILNYITLSNCIKQIKEDKSNIYLAPEVLEGNEPSYRSDIYSCGKILQTLLAGSEEDDLNKIHLFKYNEEIDKRLKELINRATNIDPLVRHNDIKEFNEELFDILSVYNELPQSIKDEYHQSISAVETKFTHIKMKSLTAEAKEGKKTSGSIFERKTTPVVVFLLIALSVAVSLILFDKFVGRGVDGRSDIGTVLEIDDSFGITGTFDDILDAIDAEDVNADIYADIIIEDAVEKDVREPTGKKNISTSKLIERKRIEEGRREEKIVEGGKIEKAKDLEDNVKKTGPCPNDMIYIKAGSFKMGSVPGDEGRQADELAFVNVSTNAYCIDRFEFPNKKGVIPKTSVTFDEADKLCGELGKRLCSEEEWERACKGVSMLKYPYDNVFDPNACNAESFSGEERKISPAGQFPKCKSSYGVFDMSGNVAEWVIMKGGQKGVKGGYVNKPDWAVRCASRRVESGSKRSPFYGFRCCMDADD